MTTTPNVYAEVAFTTDPKTRPADVDFTDLRSEDVGLRSFSCTRGSPVRTSDTETGTAQATVANQGREFDPVNAAGPWWPNVLPRKRIRFRDAAHSGKKIFTGFIERLPTRWQVGDGTVQLACYDYFGLLAGEVLAPSVLQAEAAAGVVALPTNLWPCGESNGPNADDVLGTCDGWWENPAKGDGSSIPWDPRPTQLLQHGSPDGRVAGQSMTARSVAFGADFSIACFFRFVGGAVDAAFDLPILTAFDSDGDAQIQLYIDTAGAIHMWTGTRHSYQPLGIIELGDGQWHHILVEFDHALGSGGSFFCYADATQATTFKVNGTPVGAFTADRVVIGPYAPGEETSPDWQPDRYSVALVELYDQTVSQALATSRYAAGFSAWDGDTTGERLNRILDLVGVDDDDRDIDTGTQLCGPTMLGGQNVMEYVRRINATEGGACFVDADGHVCLRERVENDPTPAFTISDDPVGDSGAPYVSVEPDYSLDRVVNIAEVSREAGDVLRSTDTDSVDAYGPRAVQLSTLHRTPSAARGRGALLVNRFSEPRLAVDTVTLAPRRSDVPTSLSLDAELQAVGSLIMRPTGGGDPIEQLVVVERLTQAMDPQGRWTMTLGVTEHVVLDTFALDTPGRGLDESVWAAP